MSKKICIGLLKVEISSNKYLVKFNIICNYYLTLKNSFTLGFLNLPIYFEHAILQVV